MNKQRKVLITVTYNEMGTIIDTKAEEVAQPDYKTDHGYMWLCPTCGLVIHSDYKKCVRCGYER